MKNRNNWPHTVVAKLALPKLGRVNSATTDGINVVAKLALPKLGRVNSATTDGINVVAKLALPKLGRVNSATTDGINVVAKLALPKLGRVNSATTDRTNVVAKLALPTLLILILASCGTQGFISAKPSLSTQIPKVVDIKPKDNEIIKPDSSVSIKFSKPVATTSINRTSLIVAEDFQDMPSKTLEEAIDDGSLACIDGEYQISEDKLTVDFHPQNSFAAGKTYGVIVTRNVLSEENLTISATIVSKFVVESANEGSSTATATSSNVATDAEQENIEEEEVLTPAQKEPITVFINELFYDAVGSDTDGNLFVELSGTASGDISGYKIVFINGDDGKITESVTIPDEAIIPSNGLYVIADAKTGSSDTTNVAIHDLIANFDPQNGPDAVQLLDADGQLADAVCYGNVAVKIAENGFAMCEGEPAPDVASGQSISRVQSAEDTGNNSADFTVNQSPSPGVH